MKQNIECLNAFESTLYVPHETKVLRILFLCDMYLKYRFTSIEVDRSDDWKIGSSLDDIVVSYYLGSFCIGFSNTLTPEYSYYDIHFNSCVFVWVDFVPSPGMDLSMF